MFSFSSINFFGRALGNTQASSSTTTYGSLDSRDTVLASKKQGLAKRVDDLVCKITTMVSALAAEKSQLRDWSFLVVDKATYNNLITIHENHSCPRNDWPFGLNESDLENFLLGMNLDIKIYRDQLNKRALLHEDLMASCKPLSQVYLFTQAECQLIKSFQTEACYKQLTIELMNFVETIESGKYDKKAFKIFSDNLNKLIDFLRENFIQFHPRVFKFSDATDIPKEVLVQQLVLLGIQLKPFVDVGTENKDYTAECAFTSPAETTAEADEVYEVEEYNGPIARYCSIM
ncbi:MAG: hypothetical protein V4501_02075 [Pseudomonadota bacterium]